MVSISSLTSSLCITFFLFLQVMKASLCPLLQQVTNSNGHRDSRSNQIQRNPRNVLQRSPHNPPTRPEILFLPILRKSNPDTGTIQRLGNSVSHCSVDRVLEREMGSLVVYSESYVGDFSVDFAGLFFGV
jgi:hypothetical protein